MPTRYENTFKQLLKEESEGEQISDADAFNSSFDDEGDIGPDDFNVEPQMPGYQSRYIEKAKEWTAKIADFKKWINGAEGDSLNKQFNQLDREGSPFEGISKESSMLTGLAEKLASLEETINGYVLSADRKQEQAAAAQEDF